MTDKTKGTDILALFLIIAIALALTPTLQTTAIDSQYSSFTDIAAITPSVANTTTLTHPARNASTNALNDGYWTVLLNATNWGGQTTITFASGNLTLTAASTLTFNDKCLNKTVVYLATITYQWLSASSAIQGLVLLVPLLWIILIIACVVVIAYKKLKLG